MKKPIAIKKFFDTVFQSCRKTKVAKDSKTSHGTRVLDQTLDFYENNDLHGNNNFDEYYDCSSDSSPASTRKRKPHTGSNISKPPTLFEIPKIINPAAWVSSKTQKDTKPIKN